MIKFTKSLLKNVYGKHFHVSPIRVIIKDDRHKIWSIASYYLQFLPQFGDFSLVFLSPSGYARVSINIITVDNEMISSDESMNWVNHDYH